MRVLILGGDGYLGWPTAMHMSLLGNDVLAVDSYVKRQWEDEVRARPLVKIPLLRDRSDLWNQHQGPSRTIRVAEGDLVDTDFVYDLVKSFTPDTIIHYGEQPSAPFSMMDARHAVSTQVNNVVGTLNVLFAMRDVGRECHLVKLGTMGEYGTPNIVIEEGYLTIRHKGREDRLPFPKQPGSFYHLSKVHDSSNLHFAGRAWGLRITDLNQGVVYGVRTPEMDSPGGSPTSFHYDAVFGTVLNRFCTQAVAGMPLTVYGSGNQKRAFINIRDTLTCVGLATSNPASPGIPRVFNQFTEVFSVLELARVVAGASGRVGHSVSVQHLSNPRVEAEDHYYDAVNDNLRSLGLEPSPLSSELVESMLGYIQSHRKDIDTSQILPEVRWARGVVSSDR